jgi:branched-chain amino acid transport system permease protein
MKKNIALWVILILVFAAIPLFIKSNYLLGVLIIIGLYTIIVIGLGILMGYAGQVSFGHAAFFGMGGYTVAVLTTAHQWPTVPALIAALILPGLVAAIIGGPTLKLKELYLALATLSFGILIHILSLTS